MSRPRYPAEDHGQYLFDLLDGIKRFSSLISEDE